MEKIIKRSVPIWSAIEHYRRRQGNWEKLKTVAVISGPAGCGKTTLLLDYFKNKRYFYFSFAGLDENIAERLLSEKISAAAGIAVKHWDGAFGALIRKYKYIIFDDLAYITNCARFRNSFYECMFQDFHSRPLVFLITQMISSLTGLADSFSVINMGYFSIPETMKLLPELSKHDILGLCAVSGGIPKIIQEYDVQRSFMENLLDFLSPSSAFIDFMPHLMEKHFRRPEIYNRILCAIANGSHRISDIGRFTGFACNKCDNYLSALLSTEIVKAEKEKTKNGVEKTVYTLYNSYFKLWYLYVYQNRTELTVGNEALRGSIVNAVSEKEVHALFIQKAFSYVNSKMSDFWTSFRISDKIIYAPQIVQSANFSYSFDAIHRNGDKAVFVKVFSDPLENCKRKEIEKLRKAVILTNKYYNSHVFIFTKRRFSDYAAQQAPIDETISFVEIERLKQ